MWIAAFYATHSSFLGIFPAFNAAFTRYLEAMNSVNSINASSISRERRRFVTAVGAIADSLTMAPCVGNLGKRKTMNHIALVGDSSLDNNAYVPSGQAVIDHLRGMLPAGWKA